MIYFIALPDDVVLQQVDLEVLGGLARLRNQRLGTPGAAAALVVQPRVARPHQTEAETYKLSAKSQPGL